MGGAGEPQQEAEHARPDDHLALVCPGAGVLVHDRRGDRLHLHHHHHHHHHHHEEPHHGELGVQAEGDEHGEEEEGPDGRQRHLGHRTRVGDEGEARASLNK